jgi:hypothetical protein
LCVLQGNRALLCYTNCSTCLGGTPWLSTSKSFSCCFLSWMPIVRRYAAIEVLVLSSAGRGHRTLNPLTRPVRCAGRQMPVMFYREGESLRELDKHLGPNGESRFVEVRATRRAAPVVRGPNDDSRSGMLIAACRASRDEPPGLRGVYLVSLAL